MHLMPRQFLFGRTLWGHGLNSENFSPLTSNKQKPSSSTPVLFTKSHGLDGPGSLPGPGLAGPTGTLLGILQCVLLPPGSDLPLPRGQHPHPGLGFLSFMTQPCLPLKRGLTSYKHHGHLAFNSPKVPLAGAPGIPTRRPASPLGDVPSPLHPVSASP